jgi:hypothetical protein
LIVFVAVVSVNDVVLVELSPVPPLPTLAIAISHGLLPTY